MWIVEVALKRPYTFIVLALLLPLLGALTLLGTPLHKGMPTDIFPDIKIPIIGVAFQYSGMPPDEMAERLNRFYSELTQVIVQHGIVDKLIGAAVSEDAPVYSVNQARKLPRIGKLEAARRQIEFAIRAHFEDRDPFASRS